MWLIACAQPDPELQRFRTALDAWERGQADPAAAGAAYAEARAADPDSAVLALWQAKARADAGDLAAAEAALTEVLRAHPDAGAAWYNRAAYRARRGEAAGALEDLRQALALGVRNPLEASADPDFAELRTRPEAATVLPPAPVVLKVEGPEGSVFLRSRFGVEAYVGALEGVPVELWRQGADPGCARLRRIVEDERRDRKMRVARISLDLEAVGPCTAELGPWEARAGEAKVGAPALPLRVEAPPGAGVETGALPERLPVPSALIAEDAGFAAARVGAGVAAMGRADARILAGARGPDVELELRVDGQTRARGGWWASSGPLELQARGWSQRVD